MPVAKKNIEAQPDALFLGHPDLQPVEALMKSFSIGQRPLSPKAKDHLRSGVKDFEH